jgi:SAM-dependent methyltransferase
MTATRDPYTRPQEMDAALAARMAAALEQRAADARQQAFRDDYLARLDLAPDARLLDLGCGTGALARHLAGRPGFRGTVLGLDLSPTFLAAAGRLATEEGVADRVTFRVGDAAATGLPDGACDAAILHTVLSHVADPAAVLGEAARVVRPGGRVAAFDGDYAGLIFDDPEGAVPFVATLCAQPRVMRDLAPALAAAGLALDDVRPYAYAEIGRGGYLLGLVERFSAVLIRDGDAAAQARVDRLRARHEAGRFFAAVTYYAYLAHRPG